MGRVLPFKSGILILLLVAAFGQPARAQSFSLNDIGFVVDITSSILDLISFSQSTPQEPSALEQLIGVEPEEPTFGSRWLVQAHGTYAIPIGTFNANMRESGWGFGGEVLTSIKGPVMAGLHVSGARFDNFAIGYNEVFDGELYEYDELTASRLLLGHVAVRFEPEIKGILQPYAQGLIGAHWYYTNTRIKDVGANEVVDRFNESSDVVLGFGAQLGLQVAPPKWQAFGIDLRAGYMTNGSVTYMRYDPRLTAPNGYPAEFFEEKTSPVQMITIQLGVFGRF